MSYTEKELDIIGLESKVLVDVINRGFPQVDSMLQCSSIQLQLPFRLVLAALQRFIGFVKPLGYARLVFATTILVFANLIQYACYAIAAPVMPGVGARIGIRKRINGSDEIVLERVATLCLDDMCFDALHLLVTDVCGPAIHHAVRGACVGEKRIAEVRQSQYVPRDGICLIHKV